MAAERAGKALVLPWEACAVKSSRMGRHATPPTIATR